MCSRPSRSHMLAAVINEMLPNGWLEFLTGVKLEAGAADADAMVKALHGSQVEESVVACAHAGGACVPLAVASWNWYMLVKGASLPLASFFVGVCVSFIARFAVDLELNCD